MIDTIVALATPSGRGGVGIVRVSGPKSANVATIILGSVPKPRHAEHCPFLSHDGMVIDEGITLYFKAPHSFTGEDVIEFQGHGGVVVLDRLMKEIIKVEGVRLAKPGEFSERAFLNDKMDLVQAEAIADLIDASSEQAAMSAVRSLQGEFSKKIQVILRKLIQLRLYVEAAIDFPEEEIDFLADKKVGDDLSGLIESLGKIRQEAQQGALLKEGIQVVITGKPNAGKSSLLNCLSGRQSAIVTHVPGTTRDVLREHIQLDGLPLHIIDTAGLRESDNIVEQEGIKRALHEIQCADIVLFIIDSNETKEHDPGKLWPEFLDKLPVKARLIVVHNKIDLTDSLPSISDEKNYSVVCLSVIKNEGIDLLVKHVKECAGYKTFSDNTFMARRRHLDALRRACWLVCQGKVQLETHKAGELLAEDLRQAQNALSEVTGEFTPDDLLGEIFSSFCIGK